LGGGLANASDAKIDGFELEALIGITENFQLSEWRKLGSHSAGAQLV
jgi:hypothetical protein